MKNKPELLPFDEVGNLLHVGDLVYWFECRFPEDYIPGLVTRIYDDEVVVKWTKPGEQAGGITHGNGSHLSQRLVMIGKGVQPK